MPLTSRTGEKEPRERYDPYGLTATLLSLLNTEKRDETFNL
jgi:hypothetical protein